MLSVPGCRATWISALGRASGHDRVEFACVHGEALVRRSVATVVLAPGTGAESPDGPRMASARATGLCRPSHGGFLTPQGIQLQSLHNQKVGTIGDRGRNAADVVGS
jgi:hypothetical protein